MSYCGTAHGPDSFVYLYQGGGCLGLGGAGGSRGEQGTPTNGVLGAGAGTEAREGPTNDVSGGGTSAPQMMYQELIRLGIGTVGSPRPTQGSARYKEDLVPPTLGHAPVQ